MGRQLKSATRTISNRGEHARFIGIFPCTKGVGDRLHFDSITALYVGIFLEWLPRVIRLYFEPRKLTVNFQDKSIGVIPDYEAAVHTGEIEAFEAKYEAESLKDEERERLKAVARHYATEGSRYQVLFRKTLERRGFIQTICLLRRYGNLTFPERALKHAREVLASPTPKTLREYRKLALAHGIRVGVLYHLAYRRQLRLRYELPRHEELALCHV